MRGHVSVMFLAYGPGGAPFGGSVQELLECKNVNPYDLLLAVREAVKATTEKLNQEPVTTPKAK